MPSTPTHAAMPSPGATSVTGHAPSSLLSASPATYGMMTPPTSASFSNNTATMSPVHHPLCDPPSMASPSGQSLNSPYLTSPAPTSASLQQQGVFNAPAVLPFAFLRVCHFLISVFCFFSVSSFLLLFGFNG